MLRDLVRGKEHNLKYQYRCGRQLCKLADELGRDSAGYIPLLPTSHYDETTKPSSVEYARFNNLEEQGERIVEKLSVQLRAYPGELFGVLCPRSDDVDEMWRILMDSEIADLCSLRAFSIDRRAT